MGVLLALGFLGCWLVIATLIFRQWSAMWRLDSYVVGQAMEQAGLPTGLRAVPWVLRSPALAWEIGWRVGQAHLSLFSPAPDGDDTALAALQRTVAHRTRLVVAAFGATFLMMFLMLLAGRFLLTWAG